MGGSRDPGPPSCVVLDKGLEPLFASVSSPLKGRKQQLAGGVPVRAGVCAKSRMAWSVGGTGRARLMAQPFHLQPQSADDEAGTREGRGSLKVTQQGHGNRGSRNHGPVRTHGAETIQRQMPFPARGDVGIEEATRRVWGWQGSPCSRGPVPHSPVVWRGAEAWFSCWPVLPQLPSLSKPQPPHLGKTAPPPPRASGLA